MMQIQAAQQLVAVSVPGGMDHLVAAMDMEAAGRDALGVKYIPYECRVAKRWPRCYQVKLLHYQPGFSEAVELAAAGEVKIIGVTSEERVSAAPDAYDDDGARYRHNFCKLARCFFGAPGMPARRIGCLPRRVRKNVCYTGVGSCQGS